MGDAIAVAEGLLKGGGVPMSRDQLAAAMGLAPGGGGFATKIATARIFGISDSSTGKYALTELGFELVDPSRQQEAKVKAFLNVELYKRTYDEFRNKLLPPRPHGLDAAFINFGVTAKNVRFARLAFEKSARLAGFYPGGSEDRLVAPFGAPVVSVSTDIIEAAATSQVGTAPIRETSVASSPAPVGIHKSILGMLEELPAPKSKWDKIDQANWLEAMATLFQVIYKSDDPGAISVSYSSPTMAAERFAGNI